MRDTNSPRQQLTFGEYANNVKTILQKYDFDTEFIDDNIEKHTKNGFYSAPEMRGELADRYKSQIFGYITTMQNEFGKEMDKEFMEFFNTYT